MPDPGEPHSSDLTPFDPTPFAAGRTSAGPAPAEVHLVLQLSPGSTWSTRCPADVAGLLPGQQSRRTALTVDPIDCSACRTVAPETVTLVDERNAIARARDGRNAAAVSRFLQFLQEQDPPIVLARVDGTALPKFDHEMLLQLWAHDEQQRRGA